MKFIFIFIMSLLAIQLCTAVFFYARRFLLLWDKKKSFESFKSHAHLKNTATRMYFFLDSREEEKAAKMTDSNKRFVARTKKWKAEIEKPHRKVKRRQREARRVLLYTLLDNGLVNFDILFLILEFIYVTFFLVFCLKCAHFSFFFIPAVIPVYVIGHFIWSKAANKSLRYSHIRPWNLFTHMWVKGFTPIDFRYILFLMFINVHALIILLVIGCHLAYIRLPQTFLGVLLRSAIIDLFTTFRWVINFILQKMSILFLTPVFNAFIYPVFLALSYALSPAYRAIKKITSKIQMPSSWRYWSFF